MDIRTMYSLLTRMPLLQGINGMELARIEEQAQLQIEQVSASRHPFIKQGDICKSLIFLVSGTMNKETLSADKVYKATETIFGPAVIEADRLFGLQCEYDSTYRLPVECQIMQVMKQDVVLHMLKNDIFRTNYINMISAKLHRQQIALQCKKFGTPESKIRHFITKQFSLTAGKKYLDIKMTDLAEYIGETRLTVSIVLNRWKEEGIIDLKRKEIVIDDITRFVSAHE